MPDTAKRTCLTVILAAGEGTRMRSTLPKVMHPVAGLPMLGHVLAASGGEGARRAVVIGPDVPAVRAFLAKAAPDASVFEQSERLGTGHAVLAARKDIAEGADDLLIVYGDTPLVTRATLEQLRKALADGADIAVYGFRAPDPTGYGRLVVENGSLMRIVEERDANAAERKIGLVNGGLMAIRGAIVLPTLDRIRNDNAKKEFYLTDAVAIAGREKRKVVVVEGSAEEVIGVNTRAELAEAERLWQERARRRLMEAGVTLVAPDTVFLSHDTVIGRDTIVEPNVFFGPGVSVGEGALIRSFSHLDGAEVAKGAIVGPFARLRPGAAIAEGAHVGNFVEVKNARIGAGAKVNHLTYVGDASVGAKANLGAGTITCNYDGFAKHWTEIGAGAFIGSNSALVAPVKIGDGAYIGSGSVITKNVEAGALAVARGRQVEKPGWAARLRERMAARRKPS